MKKNKINKKILKEGLFFLLIFCLIFCYFYFINTVHHDAVWNYGFAHNIANGLIPYRDFNMVILPFYQIIIAFFLKLISGDLIVYHLINALFVSFIIYLTGRKNYINTIFVILCLFLTSISYGYNMFIAILTILILYIEENNLKYKNLIIGLIIGIISMTKPNIGFFLFIPYFIFSKHKIKSIIFVSVPVLIILFYLIFNDIVFECIDYCFLGLRNFKNSNSWVDYPILILVFSIVLYSIYKYKKTKDKNFLYLAFFQGICYPICDPNHFYSAILPVCYYFLRVDKNRYVNLFIKLFIAIFLFLIVVPSIFINGIYLSQYDGILKYRRFSATGDYYLEKIENYITENQEKRIFIFSNLAYTIKLDLKMNPDKFDLINYGNMGSDETKYISEIDSICDKQECLFIIDIQEFDEGKSQLNSNVRAYVLNNYEYIGDITPRDQVYSKKIDISD